MKILIRLFCVTVFLTLVISCSSDPVNTDESSNDTNASLSALEVTAATPEPNAEVSVLDSVVLTFSNDLDCNTVNAETIKVGPGMSGTIRCSQRSVVFKPDLAFDFAIAVEVTVSKDIKVVDGVGMEDDYKYIFCTEVEPGG